MAKIKLYTRNILETGTFTITGDEETGYPEERVYDRDISLYWQEDVLTSPVYFHVDQGASSLAIDALIVEGHNFNGRDLQWQWSENDSDWNDAVTDWTQGDALQIVKTLSTALTKRYWRLVLTTSEIAQCTEIFMTYGYEFQVRFDNPPDGMKRTNIGWQESVGGIERSTKYGDRKRVRSYSLFLNETNLANFRSAMDDLDEGAKPFYIKDHEDDYWMCRLTSDPRERYLTPGTTPLTIEVLEKL